VCDLKNKLDQWEEWCFGDDVNSIKHQIHRTTWDSAVFQCINEARRYAPRGNDGEPELNATVHEYINRSFFETQAIAIRRLLDSRNDVVSLHRLIKDVQRNCSLLTRAGLLAAHEYPYDYEQERAKLREEYGKGSPQRAGQGLINCAHSETMHGFMDALAGVDSSLRKPTDTARPEIFAWLLHRLDNCEEIFQYVNKFLAHSATPDSRARVSADDLNITLGKVFDAHRVICETVAFIGMKILYRSFGNFLAIPQYDQFRHFERPWVTKETVKKLRKFWDEYDKKTRQWEDWDWQAAFNESS